MNCLIAGATGLVGKDLLVRLLEDTRVTSVVALARGSLDIERPKLKVIKADFNSLGKLPASDVAFCCLGTTIRKAGSQREFYKVDHDYVLSFARASREAGVRSFYIVTAMGANAGSRVFYNRVKGQTEKDLMGLGFDRLVIFQPSLLLGDRKERRLTERFAQKLSPVLSPLMIGPFARSRPIASSAVAASMHREALAETRSGVRIVSNAEMGGWT